MFEKTYLIGTTISVQRRAQEPKMSRGKLASLVYSSEWVIRCIENGGAIDKKLLKLICDVLGLDFDVLVEAEEKEQQRQKALQSMESVDLNNLSDAGKEAMQTILSEFKEPPKHKSFLKRVFGILVVIAALTLASTIAYASYKKIYLEIAAIDKEHHRIVLRTREEGVEDDYVYRAPEDDIFPDYVRGETYQSSDYMISRNYFEESKKMKLQCVTAEGQEYQYSIQEIRNFTAERMKKALNYSCEEKKILLGHQTTITLYYTESKAFFVLEDLLYVFSDYDFGTEQLISIIENMKKQIAHSL